MIFSPVALILYEMCSLSVGIWYGLNTLAFSALLRLLATVALSETGAGVGVTTGGATTFAIVRARI